MLRVLILILYVVVFLFKAMVLSFLDNWVVLIVFIIIAELVVLILLKALLFVVNKMEWRVVDVFLVLHNSRNIVNIFIICLLKSLKLVNNVDCNGAKVVIDEWHAPFGITGHEQGAAPTKAVTVMLARHSIASINGTKDVAR